MTRLKITKRMQEKAEIAAHAYLESRFPNGALPGGIQLFATDSLDATFQHEKGCAELAKAILTAALTRR